jgi:drug/metabolite transporter (DMT)-like permease
MDRECPGDLRPRQHALAGLQALLVTFLWSTSWVLLRIGLTEIPPLTFAGLRYAIAVLCLAPLAAQPARRASLRGLSRQQWLGMISLGLLFYTLTQGSQYLALAYLPVGTVSLLLGFSSVVVAFLGMTLLAERLSGLGWIGMLLSTLGTAVYFHPFSFASGRTEGLVAAVVGPLANGASSLLGRHINRQARIPPLMVTMVSMAVGAAALLATGLLTQGLPRLTPASWLIVTWLAVVNTAFAFTLWNHTLRTLSAIESSIISNTMLVQIAVLAWVFLGERFSAKQLLAMALVGVGALMVQLWPGRATRGTAE